ncbi:hypothetical protein DFJ74DRAFT_677979 [Hyaloraphidium curvatum]|nr:hypothetical protein DFJ74DRAFT_677979 [Hyaloraphidium curvatum]
MAPRMRQRSTRARSRKQAADARGAASEIPTLLPEIVSRILDILLFAGAHGTIFRMLTVSREFYHLTMRKLYYCLTFKGPNSRILDFVRPGFYEGRFGYIKNLELYRSAVKRGGDATWELLERCLPTLRVFYIHLDCAAEARRFWASVENVPPPVLEELRLEIGNDADQETPTDLALPSSLQKITIKLADEEDECIRIVRLLETGGAHVGRISLDGILPNEQWSALLPRIRGVTVPATELPALLAVPDLQLDTLGIDFYSSESRDLDPAAWASIKTLGLKRLDLDNPNTASKLLLDLPRDLRSSCCAGHVPTLAGPASPRSARLSDPPARPRSSCWNPGIFSTTTSRRANGTCGRGWTTWRCGGSAKTMMLVPVPVPVPRAR